MIQPNRSDHHESPPPDGADIIDFIKASREREFQPHLPEHPVERYLLSAEGIDNMSDLYETIDESGSIVKTLAFEISIAHRFERDTIFTLFQHKRAGQGLTRLELVDLYSKNPLIKTTLAAVHRKNDKGDDNAKRLYTYGLRVFTNMIRYEWLTRTHDPQDPAWVDRASRLGDYDSGVYRVHLQPGHNRPDVVSRHKATDDLPDTPSDYLVQHPLT